MSATGHSTRALRQAQLPLHFVIVGGGLSGLSSAIALTRVGHRVTVLEQQKEFPQTAGALRIPPNQTKILGHWGLRAEAEKIGLKSRAVAFTRYEGNLHLGHHFWDEEVLRECGGDWLLVRYSAFHAFLLECARANGATIRLGARVSQVAENETATVILDNGEHVRGDVIIAADGEAGLARKAVIGREERVQGNGLVMYSAMVPLEEMSANPELATLLRVGDNHPPVTVWFGDSRTAVGYPVGEPFYQLYFYAPLTEEMGPNVSVEWDRDIVSREELVKSLGDDADPRMKTLANLAVPHMSTRIAMQEFEQLDDWVHDDIPLVLLGDAAHPSVMGMIQSSAMIMEDAAALAKLFSHVYRSEQIPKLLSAFFTLRQARTHSVLASEMANVRFMSLSNSDPTAQSRDANFISRRDQGLNVLDAGTSSDEAAVAQWEQIRETWAYDAEDDADDWWVAWGATAERAIAANSPIGQGAFIDFSNSFASAVQMSTTVEG